MKIALLGCSEEDSRQIACVAASVRATVVVVGSRAAVHESDATVLFLTWPAGHSAFSEIEAIRLSAIPVIVLLGQFSTDLREKAFNAGALDVISSPVDREEVRAELEALSAEEPAGESIRRAEFERLTQKVLIGSSLRFKKCVEQLRKATHVDANVLLMGETGTGKEVFARALHMASHRSSHPFRGVNCAAIPESLLESELFGSRKGAFSGAENIEGQFEAVRAGTLLLDEIGEMKLSLQAKLLRVVQEREFQPLGSSKVIRFNARLVSATLFDLREAVAGGSFRADLAERLDQLRIVLPPLRERRQDIIVLARHFIRARSQGRPIEMSVSAMRMLEEADYPGNIRELENTIIKAIAGAVPGTIILPQHLPRDLFGPRAAATAKSTWRVDASLEYSEARQQAPIEVDRVYLGRLLREHRYNKTEAAKAAGIDRKTFTERWKGAGGMDEE